MKIQIETLDKVQQNDKSGDGEFIYELDESKTIVYPNLETAQTAFLALESLPNKKFRILEYHNEDPDLTRIPCKVIDEK